MRKFATGLASALLIVGLSACGSAEDNSSGPTAPTVAPSVTPPPSFTQEPTEPSYDVPEQTAEQVFLDSLHEAIPETTAVPDEMSLELAENICLAFDADASFEDVALTLLDSADFWTEERVGTFMGLSVGAFCPEHSDIINDFAGL